MRVSLKNTLAFNFSIYFLGSLILKSVSFITTPIFTRILSQEDYGIISIYQTWVSIFAIFIGLQMSGSIATARVHLEERVFLSYLKSVLALSFIAFFIISGVSFLFGDWLVKILELDSKLLPFLLVQAFGTSCSVFYLTYTIQLKKAVNHLIFSVASTVAMIALSLILILYMKEDKYIGRVIGGFSVAIPVILFVYLRLFFAKKSKISIAHWRYALPLSLPLIVHLVSNLVVSQSDKLILNEFLGYDTVAIYSVAYTMGSLGLFISEATNNVWSPWYLDNTKRQDNEKINEISKKYILVLSFVFVVITFTAPEFLSLMTPESYQSGEKAFIIITLGVFFQFLYRFPLGYEQYSKNMKWVAVATIITALLNIGLNYYLIPTYGMEGAAYATLISYIILFLMHENIARFVIKGYNIHFLNYGPGSLLVFTGGILSTILLDYIFVRYIILFVLIVVMASWAKKVFRNKIPLIKK